MRRHEWWCAVLVLALVAGCDRDQKKMEKEQQQQQQQPETTSPPATSNSVEMPTRPEPQMDPAIAALKLKYPKQLTIPGTTLRINLPDNWRLLEGNPGELGRPEIRWSIRWFSIPPQKLGPNPTLERFVGRISSGFRATTEIKRLRIAGEEAASFESRFGDSLFLIHFCTIRDGAGYDIFFQCPIAAPEEMFRSFVNDVVQTIEPTVPTPPAKPSDS